MQKYKNFARLKMVIGVVFIAVFILGVDSEVQASFASSTNATSTNDVYATSTFEQDFPDENFRKLIEKKVLRITDVDNINQLNQSEINKALLGIKKINIINNLSFFGIRYLKNLEEISLHLNGINFLPEPFLELAELENLNYLTLNALNLESLPSEFSNLKVRDMEIRSDRIKSLPASFSNLAFTRTLRLYVKNLETLPEDFGKIKSLNALSITSDELEFLPSSFSELASTTSLMLLTKKLKKLPEDFGEMRSLTSLSITSDELEFIPESFSKLSDLKILNLYIKKLKSLSIDFSELDKLLILFLESNAIESLPNSLSYLEGLIYFEIYRSSNDNLDFKRFNGCFPNLISNNFDYSHDGFCKALAGIPTIKINNNLLIPTEENRIYLNYQGKYSDRNYHKNKTKEEAESFCTSLGKGWQLPTVDQYKEIFDNKPKGMYMRKNYFTRKGHDSTTYPVRYVHVGYYNGKLKVNTNKWLRMKDTDTVRSVICVFEK